MATSDQRGFSVETDSLTGLHWVGVLAAVVSGLIHLFLGVQFAPSGLGVSFLFAGIVFMAAVALVLLDFRRRTVYALGIPFTAGQIVLWYYFNFAAGPYSFPSDVGPLGVIDKLAQVALIAVLVVLLRES